MRTIAVSLAFGILAWWLLPIWLILIIFVLLFMRGATRKNTPRRR